LLKVHIVTQI